MEPPAEGDIWEGGALSTRPASGAVHPRPSPLTHARASRDVCRRREAVPHGEGRRQRRVRHRVARARGGQQRRGGGDQEGHPRQALPQPRARDDERNGPRVRCSPLQG
eukprot:scaffold110704_cov39-Phaeocystis_antarctica.AAC.3